MGKKIGYIRVSTIEQNEARQLEKINTKTMDKVFSEKLSAGTTNRPQLQAMLDYVREGDKVYIHEFSRLARNTIDLLSIVDMLNAKGVQLISMKESFDTSTPTGKLMLTMLGAIAEFERAMIRERQAEGIAIAKQEGKYKGRKAVEIENKVFKKQYNKYLNREMNKKQLAEVLKVSRPTLDKMIQEYTEKEGK